MNNSEFAKFAINSLQGDTPDHLSNRRLLVIDDNTSIHDDVRKILPSAQTNSYDLGADEKLLFGASTNSEWELADFEIDFAIQGDEGVGLVAKAVTSCPYSVALIDVRMPPGIDGIETTRRIWEVDPRVQVVLCTAYSDYSLRDMLKCLDIQDRLLVLKKPYDPIELALMVVNLSEKWRLSRITANAFEVKTEQIADSHRVLQILEACQHAMEGECETLQNHADALSERIQRQTTELLGTREITCLALAQLAESRDPETGEHLCRMQAFSQVIANQLANDDSFEEPLNSDFLHDLWRSSPLHDIGKVGIPDCILLKPGRLTAEEFLVMRQHAEIGATAIDSVRNRSDFGGFLSVAADIARYHHERFDGKGYPHGLKNFEIPLSARIVAVADVFDALTSKRVYKDAIEPRQAREMILADAGSHFDPRIVAAFEVVFDKIVAIRDRINCGDSFSIEQLTDFSPSEHSYANGACFEC